MLWASVVKPWFRNRQWRGRGAAHRHFQVRKSWRAKENGRHAKHFEFPHILFRYTTYPPHPYFSTVLCKTHHRSQPKQWVVPPPLRPSPSEFTHVAFGCKWNGIDKVNAVCLGHRHQFVANLDNVDARVVGFRCQQIIIVPEISKRKQRQTCQCISQHCCFSFLPRYSNSL